MTKRSLAALAGAAALALQPAVAAAQAPCIAEDEVSAMAIYAVPSVVRSLQQRCAPQLSAHGFLQREGDALAARYGALQNRVWPKAKAGVLKFVRGKADIQGAQSLAMIAGLPDEHVRPLVDALIVQEVAPKVPLERCGSVERMVEALAPIDPQLAGRLIGVATGLFASEEPLLCPARAT